MAFGFSRIWTWRHPNISPDTPRPSNSCSELAAIWASRLAALQPANTTAPQQIRGTCVHILISLECLHTIPFFKIILIFLSTESKNVSLLQSANHHFQVPTDRLELIVHSNLPIIQILCSHLSSLLFKWAYPIIQMIMTCYSTRRKYFISAKPQSLVHTQTYCVFWKMKWILNDCYIEVLRFPKSFRATFPVTVKHSLLEVWQFTHRIFWVYIQYTSRLLTIYFKVYFEHPLSTLQ